MTYFLKIPLEHDRPGAVRSPTKLFEMKENNLVQIMSLFRSDKIIFTHI
jgi:hypothetical protein